MFNLKICLKCNSYFFSTIAKPFDGRMTYGRAFFLIICIWTYTSPWVLLPLTEKWNRYVPGKSLFFKIICTYISYILLDLYYFVKKNVM